MITRFLPVGRVAVCLAGLLTATAAFGHPGSGLEVDAAGRIYLSDIFRETIWIIEPAGRTEPLVEDVWSHEFHLDRAGDLVYEHEHDGEPAPQSLWKVRPGKIPQRLVAPPSHRSRFGGTAVVRTPEGEVIFAHTKRGEDDRWYARLMVRPADDEDGSRVRILAGTLAGPLYRDGPAGEATFRMITDLRYAADGTLWILDRDRIRRLDPEGTVSTRGPSLIEDDPADPPFRDAPETTWNRLYGLAIDGDGAAYVGYFAGRRVTRVDPEGSTTTAHVSESGWTPVGVAIGPAGRLYVSEASDRGHRLRVVRVGKDGHGEILAVVQNPDD